MSALNNLIGKRLDLTAENLAAFVEASGGGVSFVNIDEAFEDTHGECEMAYGATTNIVLWSRASKKLATVINEALDRGLVTAFVTAPIVYHVDGRAFNLPIASGERDYRKPHWLPIVFNPPTGGAA